jgi:hypothetical protein
VLFSKQTRISILTEYQRIGWIRKAGSEWVRKQNYWLFGTCMYRDGSIVDEWRLIRDAKLFFNALDRNILTRKLTRSGKRLERLVFAEHGQAGVNAHMHFFIKGTEPKQRDLIVVAAERLWREKIAGARDCVVLDNTCANRAGYGWKEFGNLAAKTLLVECCY